MANYLVLYSYRNLALGPRFDAEIAFSSRTRQVNFLSSRGWSGWHGNARLLSENILHIEFDYKGRENMGKFARVHAWPTHRDAFGADYRGRSIEMHFKSYWREENGVWKLAPDSDDLDWTFI